VTRAAVVPEMYGIPPACCQYKKITRADPHRGRAKAGDGSSSVDEGCLPADRRSDRRRRRRAGVTVERNKSMDGDDGR